MKYLILCLVIASMLVGVWLFVLSFYRQEMSGGPYTLLIWRKCPLTILKYPG